MKMKDTNKTVFPGKFQPFKVTFETENEARWFNKVIGSMGSEDDEAAGLEHEEMLSIHVRLNQKLNSNIEL